MMQHPDPELDRLLHLTFDDLAADQRELAEGQARLEWLSALAEVKRDHEGD